MYINGQKVFKKLVAFKDGQRILPYVGRNKRCPCSITFDGQVAVISPVEIVLVPAFGMMAGLVLLNTRVATNGAVWGEDFVLADVPLIQRFSGRERCTSAKPKKPIP